MSVTQISYILYSRTTLITPDGLIYFIIYMIKKPDGDTYTHRHVRVYEGSRP